MTPSVESVRRILTTSRIASIHLYGNTQPINPLKPNYASCQYVHVYIRHFFENGKANRDEGNDITREVYPTATCCTNLTTAQISSKQDISTWPCKEPFAWNSHLERLYRTLRPSSPTQGLRSLSRLITAETLFTSLAVKHEYHRNFWLFETGSKML